MQLRPYRPEERRRASGEYEGRATRGARHRIVGIAVLKAGAVDAVALGPDRRVESLREGPLNSVQAVIGVAGARWEIQMTVEKIPGKPQAFVAHGTLPAHTCLTTADFLVRQRDTDVK